MPALDVLPTWPVTTATGAVIDATGVRETIGDTGRVLPIASVTKLLVAYACLVAIEEGTLTLDQPAGPPGATVRHLRSEEHTSELQSRENLVCRLLLEKKKNAQH